MNVSVSGTWACDDFSLGIGLCYSTELCDRVRHISLTQILAPKDGGATDYQRQKASDYGPIKDALNLARAFEWAGNRNEKH